ncbi:hypothetical protein GGF46_003122 [Coemansia sp. RSA 552]|nr:hypothetical protein GGF46_003122 [Coemansia sp. RSA 552]
MVDPIHTALFTVPEHFSHLEGGYSKSPGRTGSTQTYDTGHSDCTMPMIGGHKTLSSLLHLSGSSSKADGRAAFSPYTGSLSGPLDGRTPGASSVGAPSEAETVVGTPSLMFGTSIALNVRYVAKDMWRKVTFPPGITVTQARDICMLRFNVWQQTLAQSEAAASEGSSATGAVGRGAPPIAPPGSAAGKGSRPETREQYGLFWTSAGHWLGADEMLNAYPLRKNEVLELQHTVDFIPLQPHEFRHSYAESQLYYMQAGEAQQTWELFWAVLRARVLRLYRHKDQHSCDIEIDLTSSFRVTGQDGRSWPRSSSKSGASAIDAASIQSLHETLPAGISGSGGGLLVIQVPGASSSSAALEQRHDARAFHALRSCDAFNYDVWHRSLRRMLANGGGGVPSSGSGSISGASNNSSGVSQSMQSLEMASAHTHGADAVPLLSPQMSQHLRPSSTRHEGYVNRKSSSGYGFRRRYCVLLPTALYGFLHADNCKDMEDAELIAACEFAIALDPSMVTVEAIAWNGRYLLRVFGPASRSLHDKPGATSLQPEENTRIQCTDILATAAQAAIEQHGSTFGVLPDSLELARLMVDDSDEGQTWAVGFNSIAGLQVTSQSKVAMSARRTNSLAESRSSANLKHPIGDFHTMPALRTVPPPDERDEHAVSTDTAPPRAGPGRQQSLSEFIVSQMDPAAVRSEPHAPDPAPPSAKQQDPPAGINIHQRAEPPSTPGDGSGSGARPAPKWIPLSIDKYIKEDEERRRQQVESNARPHRNASRSSDGGQAGLRPKPSNVSDHDSHGYPYDGSSTGTRQPAKFSWFKRRGSTSR